jgi:hypothetical protein
LKIRFSCLVANLVTISWVFVTFGEPISGQAVHRSGWIKIYHF